MTKNYTDRRDAVFDSPEYLADVLARCAYIEKNFYRNNNKEKAMVRDAILKIYRSILQYAAEILTVQNSGTGRGILNSITAVANQRLTQLQSSIEEEERKLHQWVQLDQHLQHGKEAENILTQLDDIHPMSLSPATVDFYPHPNKYIYLHSTIYTPPQIH